MAAINARRRRKVASGVVRAGLVLSVVLITAFVLHHPVALVLRQLTRLADGSGGGSGSARASRTSSADGRSLTGTPRSCNRLSHCRMCVTPCRAVSHISCSFRAEERLLQDSFLSANASIVDEITALGHALLHPPKQPDAAGANRVGCLPDHWTGNPGDYNLTRWVQAWQHRLPKLQLCHCMFAPGPGLKVSKRTIVHVAGRPSLAWRTRMMW
jgi:hypothetical protein